GLGLAFGTLKADGGSEQTFERASVRVAYELTAKVRALATLGYELRKAGDTSTSTPVFTVGASWNPRERTSVTLTADRQIVNSAAESNVNFTSTSVMLNVAQQIGSRYNASLGLGWENASYQALTTTVTT